jgi:hypothetical protein
VLAKGKQSSSCFRLDTRGKSLVGYGHKHYLKGICLNCQLRIGYGDHRLFVAMTSNFWGRFFVYIRNTIVNKDHFNYYYICNINKSKVPKRANDTISPY